MHLPKPLLLLPLALLALATSGKAQITIFENPFLVPADVGTPGSNHALSTYATGWEVYTTDGGLGPHAAASRVFLSKRPFLNAPVDTFGIVGIDGTGGTGPKFTFTEGLSIDSTTPDLTFNWLMGNAGTFTSLSLAVQVGGEWYASNPAAVATAGQTVDQFASVDSTTAESISLVFDPAAANWNTIVFTPGLVLSLGGPAPGDLSGDITGVGFFASVTGGGTDIIRFADFTITAVPEPSTYALAIVGLLGLGMSAIARRRKQRPLS